MLTEFYRCQSEEQQPLQGEHLDITQDICQSLWVCASEFSCFILLKETLLHYCIFSTLVGDVMLVSGLLLYLPNRLLFTGCE